MILTIGFNGFALGDSFICLLGFPLTIALSVFSDILYHSNSLMVYQNFLIWTFGNISASHRAFYNKVHLSTQGIDLSTRSMARSPFCCSLCWEPPNLLPAGKEEHDWMFCGAHEAGDHPPSFDKTSNSPQIAADHWMEHPSPCRNPESPLDQVGKISEHISPEP